MLLKQKRSVEKLKFVHPNNAAHRTAMQARAQDLQNVYVPKDKRLAKKKENERAHFEMTGKEKMPNQSYGQDLIQQAQNIHQNTRGGNVQGEEKARMIQKNRKNNFSLGETGPRDRYYLESSSRAAFDYTLPNGVSNSLPGTAKGDFKSANFKLGTEDTDYITTNNQNLMNGNLQMSKNTSQVIKSKMQNFNYGPGKQPLTYQSTAKMNFPGHIVGNSQQNAFDQRQQAALNFRKAQFNFGNDSQYQKQPNQWRSPTSHSRLGHNQDQKNEGSGEKGVDARKQNFTIGNNQQYQQNQMQSLNNQAMESVKMNDQYIKAQIDPSIPGKRAVDAKKSHMLMGNNPVTYVSSGKLMGHSINQEDLNNHGVYLQQQKDRMRKANFKLPYSHDMNMPDSMYKHSISTKANIDATKDARPNKIKYDPAELLGNKSYQQPYISENTNQFVQKESKSNQNENDAIKANIKGHHFELGYGPGGKVLNTVDKNRNRVHHSYNFTAAKVNLIGGNAQRAHNFQLGYNDSRPLSGGLKNNGVSSFIQKSIGNVPQHKPYAPRQIRTIENGQISMAKRSNWGF